MKYMMVMEAEMTDGTTRHVDWAGILRVPDMSLFTEWKNGHDRLLWSFGWSTTCEIMEKTLDRADVNSVRLVYVENLLGSKGAK